MKTIELPKLHWAELPSDEQSSATNEVIATRKQFDHNAKEVIFSALAIESALKNYITNYFVPDAEKGDLFHETLISSDQFTFAVTIRVFLAILKKTLVLKEDETKELDNLMMTVMRLRNTMTHGRLVPKPPRLVVKYYRAGPREDEITDAYWDNLERVFNRSYDLLAKAIPGLGRVEGSKERLVRFIGLDSRFEDELRKFLSERGIKEQYDNVIRASQNSKRSFIAFLMEAGIGYSVQSFLRERRQRLVSVPDRENVIRADLPVDEIERLLQTSYGFTMEDDNGGH